jgi:hypothetical protein
MEGDPKNPNAWWAVKFPSLRETFPLNWSKIPKKRLYWLIPLMIFMMSAELFLFYKLVK